MSEYNIQMNKYNALNAEYDQLYPKPMKHANTHAKDGSDPITPASIGAYTKTEADALLANKNTSNLGYIPSDADLLTWAASQTTGGVFCASPLNTNVPEFQYFVCILSIGGNEFREITACGNNGNIWRNVYVNGDTGFSWIGWERLATAADLDTKVSKSGDTMTGDLYFPDGKKLWFYTSGTVGYYLKKDTNSLGVYDQDGHLLLGFDYNSRPFAFGGNRIVTADEMVGVPKIAIGSYVGTGTYSSANPNSLTFDFEPKIVFLSVDSSSSAFDYTGFMFFIRNQSGSPSWYFYNVSFVGRSITWSGNTLSWYTLAGVNDAPERQQFNTSGQRYCYVALG